MSNPYHDELGHFCSKDKASGAYIGEISVSVEEYEEYANGNKAVKTQIENELFETFNRTNEKFYSYGYFEDKATQQLTEELGKRNITQRDVFNRTQNLIAESKKSCDESNKKLERTLADREKIFEDTSRGSSDWCKVVGYNPKPPHKSYTRPSVYGEVKKVGDREYFQKTDNGLMYMKDGVRCQLCNRLKTKYVKQAIDCGGLRHLEDGRSVLCGQKCIIELNINGSVYGIFQNEGADAKHYKFPNIQTAINFFVENEG